MLWPSACLGAHSSSNSMGPLVVSLLRIPSVVERRPQRPNTLLIELSARGEPYGLLRLATDSGSEGSRFSLPRYVPSGCRAIRDAVGTRLPTAPRVAWCPRARSSRDDALAAAGRRAQPAQLAVHRLARDPEPARRAGLPAPPLHPPPAEPPPPPRHQL